MDLQSKMTAAGWMVKPCLAFYTFMVPIPFVVLATSTAHRYCIFMSVDEELLYTLVGERVRRARQAAGLSQAKLARNLGMSRTSIVNIEAGRQHPPLHVLWDVADQLGTELSLLIPRADEYRVNGAPVKLDPETIEKIEQAASGDPDTRRDLTRFIAKALTRVKEEQ